MKSYRAHHLYYETSGIEETEPQEALHLYQRLSARNRPFSFTIFALSIVCPIIAFFIARTIIINTGMNNAWISIPLLVVFGFAPPLFWYKLNYEVYVAKHGGEAFSPSQIVWVALFNAVLLVYLTTAGTILTTLIFAFIMASPIIFLVNAALHFIMEVPFLWTSLSSIMLPIGLGILGVFALIVYLTEMTLYSMRVPNSHGSPGMIFLWPVFIKHMPVVLKYSAGEIYSFITELVVLYILYEVGVGYWGNTMVSFFGVIFAGILLGLEFSRKMERDFIFGNVLRVAQARCFIRLFQAREAVHLLRTIEEDTPDSSYKPILKYIIDSLGFFIRGGDINEYVGTILDPGYDVDLRKDKPPENLSANEFLTTHINSAILELEDEPRAYRHYLQDTIKHTIRLLKLDDNLLNDERLVREEGYR